MRGSLPLVRGLMEKGMISGAAVSLYVAVAVASIVRGRVFVLYVAIAMSGACAAGHVAAWIASPSGSTNYLLFDYSALHEPCEISPA